MSLHLVYKTQIQLYIIIIYYLRIKPWYNEQYYNNSGMDIIMVYKTHQNRWIAKQVLL